MSQELPAPLVPPDVDLRGYDFMPLYGHRLFGSDFNARASDASWRARVTLWWAAWNQVPAASLPNNDAALCRLADLGRDVKTFVRLKADALHGFVECSDGRLYHRALAAWALEAWERRSEHQAAKERLARHRAERRELFSILREHCETPSFDTPIGTLRDMALKCTGNVSGNAHATARQGQRSDSDIQNRGVGVNQRSVPDEPVDNPADPAIAKSVNGKGHGKSNGEDGQRWDDPAWWQATARTVDRPRRTGESDAEWRDGVYAAVQLRQAEARH